MLLNNSHEVYFVYFYVVYGFGVIFKKLSPMSYTFCPIVFLIDDTDLIPIFRSLSSLT
jgi:hypothetical protein